MRWYKIVICVSELNPMRRYKIVIYVSELMNWVSFSIRQPQIVKGERKFAKVIIMHKLQTIVQYKLLKGENFQFREQRRRMVCSRYFALEIIRMAFFLLNNQWGQCCFIRRTSTWHGMGHEM